MKGSVGIPELRLETLIALISKLGAAPQMKFKQFFKSQNYPSNTIKWEIAYGSGGMTPFVAPGAPAPTVGVDGVGKGSAQAAYYKEKMFFDEVYLNNLREPGTTAVHMNQQRILSRDTQKLSWRLDRREDWMCAKALIDGSLEYLEEGGVAVSVNYGVPATHKITLAADRKWSTGVNRNPVEDIFDGMNVLKNDAGLSSVTAMCTTEVLKVLMFDPNIQQMLEKSRFGNGDLFQNPTAVVGTLLGCGPLTLMDDMFIIVGWLSGNVTGGLTTSIPVDVVTDFEVGGTCRFHNLALVNVWEDRKIVAVDKANSSITVDSAPLGSYKMGRDKITMRKKYLPEDVFFMFNPVYEGVSIGEFMQAPFGLGRNWGKKPDVKDEWDPEGTWIKIESKGMPVIYHPETTYRIQVL